MKKFWVAAFAMFLIVGTVSVFAQQNRKVKISYDVSFQIINENTYDVIQAGTLSAKNSNRTVMTDSQIKIDVRRQLGFPGSKDTRKTTDGVNLRIIWVNITQIRE